MERLGLRPSARPKQAHKLGVADVLLGAVVALGLATYSDPILTALGVHTDGERLKAVHGEPARTAGDF